MDKFKEIFSGIDPLKLFPDLTSLLGKVELVLRIAVMAAPLLLLGMGLLYFLAPPKEANYRLGYRFCWAMSSVEAWQFTQRTAGMVWGILGFVLTVVMAILSSKFRGMEMDAMGWYAAKCILWQLGLIVVSIIGINITVVCFYDRKGVRRIHTRNRK